MFNHKSDAMAHDDILQSYVKQYFYQNGDQLLCKTCGSFYFEPDALAIIAANATANEHLARLMCSSGHANRYLVPKEFVSNY